MAKSTKVFASGRIYWPKIVGEESLVSNYDGNGREWTFEFEPDDPSFLKEHRLLDRLKDPDDYPRRLEERGEDEKAAKVREMNGDRKNYLFLRKPEFDREGNKNQPFRIYDGTTDEQGPWDNRKIGNGSRVDVKLDIRDWGAGKKKSIYASAIRVTDLVEYHADEFAGMDKAKSEKSEAAPKKSKKLPGKTALEDLDDDLPFE